MELGLRFLLQITYRRPVCLSSYDWIKSCLFKSFLYRTEIGHFDDFEWFLDNMNDSWVIYTGNETVTEKWFTLDLTSYHKRPYSKTEPIIYSFLIIVDVLEIISFTFWCNFSWN